jgi:hypothetical protein
MRKRKNNNMSDSEFWSQEPRFLKSRHPTLPRVTVHTCPVAQFRIQRLINKCKSIANDLERNKSKNYIRRRVLLRYRLDKLEKSIATEQKFPKIFGK